MMGTLKKIEDMMCNELEVMADKTELSRSDVTLLHEMVDIVKDIEKIAAYRGYRKEEESKSRIAF